jgi:hypothetical protein
MTNMAKGILSSAGCFGIGLALGWLIGGCSVSTKQPSLDRFSFHGQVTAGEELSTSVIFSDVHRIEHFRLRSFKLTSSKGENCALTSMGIGRPKGGGCAIAFDVKFQPVTDEVNEIICRYDFTIEAQRRILTSVFVRQGGEWKPVEERFKLEAVGYTEQVEVQP